MLRAGLQPRRLGAGANEFRQRQWRRRMHRRSADLCQGLNAMNLYLSMPDIEHRLVYNSILLAFGQCVEIFFSSGHSNCNETLHSGPCHRIPRGISDLASMGRCQSCAEPVFEKKIAIMVAYCWSLYTSFKANQEHQGGGYAIRVLTTVGMEYATGPLSSLYYGIKSVAHHAHMARCTLSQHWHLIDVDVTAQAHCSL